MTKEEFQTRVLAIEQKLWCSKDREHALGEVFDELVDSVKKDCGKKSAVAHAKKTEHIKYLQKLSSNLAISLSHARLDLRQTEKKLILAVRDLRHVLKPEVCLDFNIHDRIKKTLTKIGVAKK